MSNNWWTARRALRYGSEQVGCFKNQQDATIHARRDINKNGNKGRIEFIDTKKHIVYYDVYEEMS